MKDYTRLKNKITIHSLLNLYVYKNTYMLNKNICQIKRMNVKDLLDLPGDILCLVLSKIIDYNEILTLEEKIPQFVPYLKKCTTVVNFTKADIGMLFNNDYEIFERDLVFTVTYNQITAFIENHPRIKYYQAIINYNDNNINSINEPTFDIRARYLYLNVNIKDDNSLFNLTKLFVDGVLFRYQKYGKDFSLSIYSDYVSLRYDRGTLDFYSELILDKSGDEIKRLSKIEVNKVYKPSPEILHNIKTDGIVVESRDQLKYLRYPNIKHVIFNPLVLQVLTEKKINEIYARGTRYPNITLFEYPVEINESSVKKLQVIFPNVSKFYSSLYYRHKFYPNDEEYRIEYENQKQRYPMLLA